MPTILVFLGSLALWPTLSDRNTGLTWLDGVAALVMLTAVLIEGTADLQMKRFRSKPQSWREVVSPPALPAALTPDYFVVEVRSWAPCLFLPPAGATAFRARLVRRP